MHTRTHTHKHTHSQKHAYRCVFSNTYMQTQMHTYMHTHTHTHTHKHTHMQRCTHTHSLSFDLGIMPVALHRLGGSVGLITPWITLREEG